MFAIVLLVTVALVEVNGRPDHHAGEWSKWSDYGECSKTCGDGQKTRSRVCQREPCAGSAEQQAPCILRGHQGIGCRGGQEANHHEGPPRFGPPAAAANQMGGPRRRGPGKRHNPDGEQFDLAGTWKVEWNTGYVDTYKIMPNLQTAVKGSDGKDMHPRRRLQLEGDDLDDFSESDGWFKIGTSEEARKGTWEFLQMKSDGTLRILRFNDKLSQHYLTIPNYCCEGTGTPIRKEIRHHHKDVPRAESREPRAKSRITDIFAEANQANL